MDSVKTVSFFEKSHFLILSGLEVSTKKLTLMHVLDSENTILVSDREGYIHFIDSSGVKISNFSWPFQPNKPLESAYNQAES